MLKPFGQCVTFWRLIPSGAFNRQATSPFCLATSTPPLLAMVDRRTPRNGVTGSKQLRRLERRADNLLMSAFHPWPSFSDHSPPDPLRTLALHGIQGRMLDPYHTKLARDWIAAFGSSDSNFEPDGKDNPFTLIDCLVTANSLYAWHLIMEIVKLDTERRSLPLLAASHVERFFELHGEEMIDCIEDDIRQSAAMREMLWCVDQLATPDLVWARIQRLKSAEPPAS